MLSQPGGVLPFTAFSKLDPCLAKFICRGVNSSVSTPGPGHWKNFNYYVTLHTYVKLLTFASDVSWS